MANPYLGEIKLFGGNFAPRGWMLCSGQLLAISQYDALFSLIGTIYGGDGQNTFALPDLRGRVPIHMGNLSGGGSYTIGQLAGTESVTLINTQMPAHNHIASCNTAEATTTDPTNAFWAANATFLQYNAGPANVGMVNATTSAGGNQPHDNMVPYQVVNFIIATEGVYPTQN